MHAVSLLPNLVLLIDQSASLVKIVLKISTNKKLGMIFDGKTKVVNINVLVQLIQEDQNHRKMLWGR